MRYHVKGFSPGLMGVYDAETKDFIKNPESGRRRLFHLRKSAENLAATCNAEEEIARRKKENKDEQS